MDRNGMESLEIALAETYYRYLYTLPQEDQEPVRFMVHLEHAYWFYIDELILKFDLPSIKFHVFTKLMKDRYNFFPEYSVKDLVENFECYKHRIPVRGAILFNPTLEKVLMVSNMSKRRYGFPKGKTNQDETDEQCAIREVYEEVGYDISNQISSSEFIESNDGLTKLYIVRGVPDNYNFVTMTRGEIGTIEWVVFNDIPSKANKQVSRYKDYNFSSVHPFLPKIRKWIESQKAHIPEGIDFIAPQFLENLKNSFSKKTYFYKQFKLDSGRVLLKMNEFLS